MGIAMVSGESEGLLLDSHHAATLLNWSKLIPLVMPQPPPGWQKSAPPPRGGNWSWVQGGGGTGLGASCKRASGLGMGVGGFRFGDWVWLG